MTVLLALGTGAAAMDLAIESAVGTVPFGLVGGTPPFVLVMA